MADTAPEPPPISYPFIETEFVQPGLSPAPAQMASEGEPMPDGDEDIPQADEDTTPPVPAPEQAPTAKAKARKSPKPHQVPQVDAATRAALKAVKRFCADEKVPHTNHQIFRHFGVTARTGYRILKEAERTEPREETRGRPKALSDEQIDHLDRFLGEGFEPKMMPWKELCDAAGIVIPEGKKAPCPQSVQKSLGRRGWKKCGICHKIWRKHDFIQADTPQKPDQNGKNPNPLARKPTFCPECIQNRAQAPAVVPPVAR
ncbi:hypothetical protein GGR57DRAFT_285277 [Xylariaceae sp. FL1272]|nr:hypothetical protein GGR57DRAFT_285277 [Xylariaceae sp. FL1272]